MVKIFVKIPEKRGNSEYLSENLFKVAALFGPRQIIDQILSAEISIYFLSSMFMISSWLSKPILHWNNFSDYWIHINYIFLVPTALM